MDRTDDVIRAYQEQSLKDALEIVSRNERIKSLEEAIDRFRTQWTSRRDTMRRRGDRSGELLAEIELRDMRITKLEIDLADCTLRLSALSRNQK